MTKFAKFISEFEAIFAPTHRNWKPLTEGQLRGEGYLEIVSSPMNEKLKNPRKRFELKNGKIYQTWEEDITDILYGIDYSEILLEE